MPVPKIWPWTSSAWLGDEPVRAYREPRWARILRWGRRHRPLVAGAAALLLTAVAGLSLGIVLLGRAERETEAQRQLAVQEGKLATIMSGDANTRADSLRRRDYISRVNLANREFLDDNAGLAEQLLYGCPSNLRNWEWSHVQRLAHLELDTFVNADTPLAARRLELGLQSRRPPASLRLGSVVPTAVGRDRRAGRPRGGFGSRGLQAAGLEGSRASRGLQPRR